MNKFIAYCGLDCEKCEARIATINNDDSLRQKVSKEWSEMNNTDIPPEAINCEGCKTDGIKFHYCDKLCPVRKCAMEKGYEHCGRCEKVRECEKAAPFTVKNSETRKNLGLAD